MSYPSPSRIVSVLLLLWLTPTRPAQAEPLRPEHVRITLASGAVKLQELLQEWSPSFEVVTSEAITAGDILDPQAPKGQLRIWVVVSSPSRVRLYFADPTGERFYVRDVPLSAGLDEAGRETLVQVIVTTANAFENRAVASSVAEVEASFQNPAPTVAGPVMAAPLAAPPTTATVPVGLVTLTGRVEVGDSQKWEPDFGVFYRGTTVDAEAIGHGPGISGGLQRTWKDVAWRFSAQAQYRFPLTIDQPDCTLTLRTSSWALAAGPQWGLAETKTLGFLVLAGVERTNRELTVALDSPVEPEPSDVHYRPFVGLDGRAGTRLGEVRVTALLGIQLSLLKTHYDVSETTLFRPWVMAPHLGVELSWL